MRVTCHPRGDSLGPGSATLGGSARTPRDSTRAFNGASNGDPVGDSSPAATAPPTTKERDQEEGLSLPLADCQLNSLLQTAFSTQRRTQTRPDQTSDSSSTPLHSQTSRLAFQRAFLSPLRFAPPFAARGGKILKVLFFSGVFLNV